MISPQLAAEIRRLFEIEGWRRNTIARHLGVHHGTVTRVLAREGLGPPQPRRRASMLDPYLPFVREIFERYPELPASVLWEMVTKRGYPGGSDHFRHRIALLGLRPRKAPEAFFALRTLPGEQAQVDWAHFGSHKVQGGERRLYAFVMVLSYSRALFFRFFYDARLPSFLSGHVGAFSVFGGCARCLLYDNLKSVVIERQGSAIRFHPRILELADYYGFDPRPVAPRRGNEKGRVERAIGYLRKSFFPLRRVEQAYLEERSHLLKLPPEPFPCHERVGREAHRTPYVAFDANRYSIPCDRVARPLEVAADPDRVRVFDRHELIAEHTRSWDRGQVIEEPEHTEELRRTKRKARRHRQQDRLLRAVPLAEKLLAALAERQRRLASSVSRLLELLDEAGPVELEAAIEEALECGSPHPETVRLILDRRRHKRGLRPALPIHLPTEAKIPDLTVRPHLLTDYDPSDKEETDS